MWLYDFSFDGDEYVIEYDHIALCKKLKCCGLLDPVAPDVFRETATAFMYKFWNTHSNDKKACLSTNSDVCVVTLALLLDAGLLLNPNDDIVEQEDNIRTSIQMYINRCARLEKLRNLITTVFDLKHETLALNNVRVRQHVKLLEKQYVADPTLFEHHVDNISTIPIFAHMLLLTKFEYKVELVKRLLKMAHDAAVTKSSENAPALVEE